MRRQKLNSALNEERQLNQVSNPMIIRNENLENEAQNFNDTDEKQVQSNMRIIH